MNALKAFAQVTLGLVLLCTTFAYGQTGNALFAPTGSGFDPGPVLAPLTAESGIVNGRIVRNRDLNDLTATLRRAASPAATADAASQLTIDLFNGRTIRVVGTSPPNDIDERKTWYGNVVGANDAAALTGTVSLRLDGTSVRGRIITSEGVYEITPLSGELTAIRQLDTSQGPPDHPPPDQLYKDGQRRDEGPPAEDAPQAAKPLGRLAVVYTPAAKKKIEADTKRSVAEWIADRIEESNESFSRSHISLSVELAVGSEISYVETGEWETDRDRFFNIADGQMDSIATIRDNAKADAVILLFNNTAYCGEAKAIRATSESAFTVVSADKFCTSKFTFTHELGHLLGAEHDEAAASKPPSYAWAHGFINGDIWRTMMAYQTGCNPCNRVQYWSSPDVELNGVKMGTKETHDNARVVRDNSVAFSGFR